MRLQQHSLPVLSCPSSQRPHKRLKCCRTEATGAASRYLLNDEWTRRSVLKFLAASPLVAETSLVSTDISESNPPQETSKQLDTTITDKVYLEIGVCNNGTQTTRGLGDKAYCTNPDQLGRVVIGLYGNQVPSTVQTFLALVRSGAYNSTVFNKSTPANSLSLKIAKDSEEAVLKRHDSRLPVLILPGEYITAGKQGPSRMGEVALNGMALPANKDVMLSRSFELEHRRAGTVSLNLSHNMDESIYQQSGSYRNVSFLITTGPGPATSLDGTNIVFGKVLEGMDTIAKVTGVPTFKPVNDNMLAFNKLGSFFGDERAEKTRKKWGKPLRPVLITDTGILS